MLPFLTATPQPTKPPTIPPGIGKKARSGSECQSHAGVSQAIETDGDAMVCRGSLEAYALFDCLRIGESLLVLDMPYHRINITMTAKRFGIGLRKAAAVVGAGDGRRVVGMRFTRTG